MFGFRCLSWLGQRCYCCFRPRPFRRRTNLLLLSLRPVNWGKPNIAVTSRKVNTEITPQSTLPLPDKPARHSSMRDSESPFAVLIDFQALFTLMPGNQLNREPLVIRFDIL